MVKKFSMIQSGINDLKTAVDIKSFNEITQRYGLILSDEQVIELSQGRQRALKDTGRIEFDGGIIKKLILAFCDSPYLTQDNYVETMYDLQESFYFFKNESYDTISDDEIIEHMRTYFDGYAQGSTEYIIGTSLEELCRFARVGADEEDKTASVNFNEGDYDEY